MIFGGWGVGMGVWADFECLQNQLFHPCSGKPDCFLCKFCDTSTRIKMSRTQQKSHSFHIQVRLAVALLALSSSVHSDQQYYLPIDCDDIHRHDNNTPSGVYTIYPGGPTAPVKVYCDMATDGGGWTVSAPYLEFFPYRQQIP